MHYFRVHEVAELILILRNWEQISNGKMEKGHGQHMITAHVSDAIIPEIIRTARINCAAADLKYTSERVGSTGAFCNQMVHYGTPTWSTLNNEFRVLRESLQTELSDRRFVFIPTRCNQLLEALENSPSSPGDGATSWMDVWAGVPGCKYDSSEAVYCYALERYTASVFHSMRVAEFGLRFVAKKVGVKLSDKGKYQPIEYATWDKVITAIKNSITKARSMPSGKRKQSKLDFYSRAADHADYMKDIWRNEVSHTRREYGESEAFAVLTRVHSFVESLATRYPK